MDSLKFLEGILARFTPRDRAASILGDLTELSATRGRLWFYAAYTRTLVSLAWRTPAAFLIAAAGVWFSFQGIIWLQHTFLHHLSGNGLFRGYNTLNTTVPWRPPVRMMILERESFFLLFALPFTLVRFGPRNRLTQLSFALLLIALPIYSLRATLMDFAVVFTVCAIIVALLLPLGRRPMIVLAAACVAFYAPIEIYFRLLLPVLFRIGFTDHYYVCYYMGLVLAAIVCVYLYRPSPTPAVEAPPEHEAPAS